MKKTFYKGGAAATGGIDLNHVQTAIPSFWANIALGALKANTVMVQLVNRDYENQVATKGDVVNVVKRGTLVVNDKETGKQITLQTPTNTKIPVTLNKHKEISWLIEDTASAKAIEDAVNYVTDAAIKLGNEIDADLLKLYAQVGNKITDKSVGVDSILAAREKLNILKCPVNGRYMILHPKDETSVLKLEQFTSAQWDNDNARALREATLGRKYGFTFIMDQNVVETGGSRYNIAFTKDAFALVTRPLPAPPAGSGANSTTVEEDGISIRVTSSYSQKDGGMLWTLDVLYGVAALREEECAVVIETGDAFSDTAAIPVDSVTLDKEEASVAVGETVTLKATVLPADATDKTLTWDSSDKTKATVAAGVVTGVAAGETTITATSANGKEAECVVTVTSAE